ncbi:hypothetical protein [Sinanaerobacter sp. ZZT-01]|uniref:hypothetical protein n=1 Tax=Sinanaerobacter sp. ZZT-01 TaxID=3111540 RepID=UPI002D799AE7|nr:hypothetical protein [Sinanaerobacter sp. ZZT-01]WRR92206.1 hypothetical protein U5921_09010 [Sinanaerobacter sp. ZZT-01]
MNTTITLGDAGMILIGLGIILLLFYCILFVKNLIPSAKSLAKILQDIEVASGVAAEGAEEAKKMVSDVSTSISMVTDILKNNQSTVSAVTNLTNALASLKNLLIKQKK